MDQKGKGDGMLSKPEVIELMETLAENVGFFFEPTVVDSMSSGRVFRDEKM